MKAEKTQNGLNRPNSTWLDRIRENGTELDQMDWMGSKWIRLD